MHADKRVMARIVLLSFVTTFLLARIVVLLIMTHRIPSLYLHMGRTHVHHLNYGIFLLSFVGAFLLFRQPAGRALSVTAVVYGVGLALTFDEFGMWAHLGGPYWQRASFDAMVIITAVLGLYCATPAIRKFREWHWVATALLIAGLVVFGLVMADSLHHAQDRLSPFFEQIETDGPG